MNRQTKMALLATMTGNSIFGFSFMFSRLALAEASPFTMLMYRFILAFFGLNLLALWTMKGRKAKSTGSAEDFLRFDLRGKPVLPLLALGVVQPVIYFLCESYGIAMTNASFSGVIIALVPIEVTGIRGQEGRSPLGAGGAVAVDAGVAQQGYDRSNPVLIPYNTSFVTHSSLPV